ncbi:MAG: hypothetical protein HZY79_07935 [Rhodoblastus sp.]|nr:MAG: hypothetical protein HZY79_07935 [Rhodoblastus sp.]
MSAVAEVEPAKRGVFADRRVDWGFVASALMHIVGIAVAGIWFSDARSFEEAQEAIPIEVVTQADLNQVTQGEKEAPAAPSPPSRPSARRRASSSPKSRSKSPRSATSRRRPAADPPGRAAGDPGPHAAARAPRVAMATPEPPPRPQPAPIPAPPTPPHRPAPSPSRRTPRRSPRRSRRVARSSRRANPSSRAARRASRRAATTCRRRPASARRGEGLAQTGGAPRGQTRPAAKLIEAKRAEERARPDETQPSRFNAADVRAAISRERPQQRAAAAPQPAQTAALGSPTARAERMSPSMWGQLDGYLQEQYRGCWNKFGFDGQTYIPQIRVLFNPDGSLAAEPVLVNAPGDAAERSLADSAMRAVRRCDPIKIPPQYAPYHAQWKARTLRFDPQEM